MTQGDIFETFETRREWLADNCGQCHWQGRCDAQREMADKDETRHRWSAVSLPVVFMTGLGERKPWVEPAPCRAFLSAEYETWKNRMLDR